ncbi:Nif3-like dinuclear metal center hexameric protein [Parashewanella spongiae]|uniref:GTP cyclohydrolase 1 type 2 homolog n=1 Tax=Parashewanella spongiae TaxID=342950 RepID=A0A3A6TWB4_9GAMM|nr:Nif3-like dinuclear metal center hexameric protein [Parashewanella spongiae]MCL1077232.1 Nif3-like dinuclear metal center hexameric protein [Parashewanella spongiae]RJY18689.1 Nif3-like dinuclear metal center hexameric protein [Parashewanella spongiae]
MTRNELISYLDNYLNVQQYKDYAPNGIQVEGRDQVRRIITGVTACQSLIEEAVKLNADAILVHHGYFWKGEPQVIVGMKQRRIKTLLMNDISLFGYHLPLDGHPVVGNNKQLGVKLGILNPTVIDGVEQNLIWKGDLIEAIPASEFSNLINMKLNRKPLHIGEPNSLIKSVAWCTGGAQDYIDIVANLNIDAFISGEASERTFHSATEQTIHYFGAGHHATEKYGVQALGEHLANQFGLEHHFIDIPNPI